MQRSYKNIKFFLNYFLGPILFIWFTVSIYNQVKNQPDLHASLGDIKRALLGDQAWKFGAVILLMVLNWCIEALKWQWLLSHLEKMSLWKAVKSVTAGLAFALNTPNRIGEYGGRIMFVAAGHRIQAASLSVAGSFSQLVITLIFGCLGLTFLLNMEVPATFGDKNESYIGWLQIAWCVVASGSILSLVIYFRLSSFFRWMENKKFFNKVARHVSVLSRLDKGILVKVLALSLVRYFVFVTQYVLMMQLLQVDIQAWQAFWLTSVLYLVMAVIPSIALADLGIRGQASLELFGLISSNKIGIVAASVGIWSINLVVPALIGSILIARVKIFDNK